MKKLILVLAGVCFSASVAYAEGAVSSSVSAAASPASSCAEKAVGKNGKPLAGAAKASFIKKCEAGSKEAKPSGCEEKALDKNGKKLGGAAKASFIKKCEADAAKSK